MPYINEERRDRLTWGLGDGGLPQTPGELNFMFTWLALKYVNTHNESYQTINDVIGALEGTKLEFYRRLAAPYEDVKIEENGDVYE